MLMRHPKVDTPGHVNNRAIFDKVWAPKGWELIDEDAPVPQAPTSHSDSAPTTQATPTAAPGTPTTRKPEET